MANANKNVTRKGKRFRPNTKSKQVKKDFIDAQFDTVKKDQKPNDLSWYVVDEQILKDSARIPYALPVGIPFNRMGTVTPSPMLTLPNYDDAIPGIMVSYVMLTLGNAKNADDPVNVAANSIFQFVRSQISGSRKYFAVDLMIYFGAMDSLFAFVTWLSRLYATIFTYHQSNRYLSRALIEAQGVDYDDLSNNLASFRSRVNQILAKLGALYLPAVLPIFKRHCWLFNSYYIEGSSEKDQIYCHAPAGFYTYELDNDGAGMLRANALIDQGPLTCQNLLNILNAMVDPIYWNEDFNTISGDLMKAYQGNVFQVTEIPDIATVTLNYDEEVLLQFKNAKYKSVNITSDKIPFFDYNQDSAKVFLKFNGNVGFIEGVIAIDNNHNAYYPYGPSSSALDIAISNCVKYDWSKATLLTSPHANVEPGENMVNTRLTLGFHVIDDSSSFDGATYDGIYFGSEWPLEYRLYTYHRNRGTGNTSLFYRKYDSHLAISYDSSTPNFINSFITSQEPIRSAFKYLPEMTLIIYNGIDQTIIDPGRAYFEVDNYALISTDILEGLHNAAILGEYNIPKLALGRQ